MTSTFHMNFKNRTSDSYGLYVVRRPNIPAPEPIYEPYEIPGHDGILMPVDFRYGPIEIDVELNFMSSNPGVWGNAYRAAKNWLTGSGSLSFSDDYRWHYHVYMASIVESERTSRRIGSFTAHFVCEPYCYYWTGGTDYEYLTENYISLENQFPITAKPRYEITQAGIRGTVEILVRRGESTKQFSIETGNPYNFYKIDCEKGLVIAQMSEYSQESILWNKHATGNFEDLYIPNGEIELASSWTPESEGSYYFKACVYPLWRSL